MRSIASETGSIIGAAFGSGIAVMTAERGGADFLLAVNPKGGCAAGGAPSIASMLPGHDATDPIVNTLVEKVVAACRHPVLLGVNSGAPSAT